MNKNKGFTLIELIVVIAIIGILSTIVVMRINVIKARNENAAVKVGMDQVRTQADIFYNASGTYAGVCTPANDASNPKGIYGMVLASAQNVGLSNVTVNGTGTLTTATCNTDGTNWAAEVPLQGGNIVWCVDSAKKGLAETTSIGSGVACP